jgi:hypothetical protein
MTEHLEETEMIGRVSNYIREHKNITSTVSIHYLKLQVLFFNKRVQSINLILMRANEKRWPKKIKIKHKEKE